MVLLVFNLSRTVFTKLQRIPPVVSQVRWSQYPKFFIRPIYKPTELDKLDENEIKERKFVPVKAAKNDENSSVHRDVLVNKFINMVMKCGQKALAREIVEKAFENVKRLQLEKYHKLSSPEEKATIECDPVVIFHTAISNSMPVLYLVPVKRGGVRYMVPMPITKSKSSFFALRWMIQAAKEKDRKMRFHAKLAQELIEAANCKGQVVQKKIDLHKQCEANRAYAHYRWS